MNRHMKWSPLIAVSSLALCSCAMTGSAYSTPAPPSDTHASVVIYRDAGLAGKAQTHRYFLGDEWIASLRSGGYTVFEVDGGKPALLSLRQTEGEADAEKSLRLTPSAGKTYFVRDAMEVRSVELEGGLGPLARLPLAIISRFEIATINNPPEGIEACRYTSPLTDLK